MNTLMQWLVLMTGVAVLDLAPPGRTSSNVYQALRDPGTISEVIAHQVNVAGNEMPELPFSASSSVFH